MLQIQCPACICLALSVGRFAEAFELKQYVPIQVWVAVLRCCVHGLSGPLHVVCWHAGAITTATMLAGPSTALLLTLPGTVPGCSSRWC